MAFGSFLCKVGRIELSTADNKKKVINKNLIEKFGIFFLGIPHIGLRVRTNLILKHIKPNRNIRILDAGCGPGLYTTYLALKGYNVIGIDIDRNKIDIARKINKNTNCDSKFLQGDLNKLPFKKEEFDLILCSDVIEHIKKDVQTIKELNRVLRNGGRLILSSTGNNKFTKKFKNEFMHERAGYNKNDILNLTKSTDLKLIKSLPCLSIFGKFAWITNRYTQKYNIINAILFYPLFLISLLDHIFKIDSDPINRIFIFVKS